MAINDKNYFLEINQYYTHHSVLIHKFVCYEG
jgi:hypothetical protein